MNRSQRSQYFSGELYNHMSDDLHLAGMSERTREGYLRAVRQLADFAKRTPDQITELQLRTFFLHLKNERHFATGSLRVAFSGLKFFYTRTCRREWQTLAQMKIQNVRSLPEVLTIEQVHSIIDACTTQRMAVYFWTVYSLGLRLQEGLNLHVGDVDSRRMMVHVHHGKGAKDRYIPLPQSTLQQLRRFWPTHRHPTFLFPADGRDHRSGRPAKRTGTGPQPVPVPSQATTPMSLTAAQGAMKQITRKINFGKKVSIHTLRHSYATHLLEAGVSLRLIQQYLGHTSLQTTMVYLHLTHSAATDARKVIDGLFQRPL
jgi:integrase/recombinase XerD